MGRTLTTVEKNVFAVFVSEAKQSRFVINQEVIDCFVAKIAPRNDNYTANVDMTIITSVLPAVQ
jgi:hypothetical protein